MEISNGYGQKIPIKTNINLTRASAKQKSTDIIVLCHGFLASFNSPPIDTLYENLSLHSQVLACNFIGEGKEFPSFSECISDLTDIITYLQHEGFKQISLAGHSLGGAIALYCAAEIPGIHTLVLISMPYDLKSIRKHYHIPTFKKDDAYKQITVQGNVYRIKKEFIEDTYRYSIEKELRKIMIPTLIIQGAKDTHVTMSDAHKAYAKLFSIHTQHRRWKQLKSIQGAGHLFIQKKAQQGLFREIESFLIT